MAFTPAANPATVPNIPQKIVVYVMPDHGAGHKFMAMRRCARNVKGRYVTADEFFKAGLFYPTSIARTRDELAVLIGRSILDEAGVV